MDNENKWHNAATDRPKTSAPVLLRVEKDKNPDNVAFIAGYYSGYEYCDKSVEVTHYDRVTHWIELPNN